MQVFIVFFCRHLERWRTLFTTFSSSIQLEFQQCSLWSETLVASHLWKATNMSLLKPFPQFRNFKTVLKLDTKHFTGKLLEKYRQNVITRERNSRKTNWITLLLLHEQCLKWAYLIFFVSLKAAIPKNIPPKTQSDSNAVAITQSWGNCHLFLSSIVNFVWCFFAYIEYPIPKSLRDEQFLNRILIL